MRTLPTPIDPSIRQALQKINVKKTHDLSGAVFPCWGKKGGVEGLKHTRKSPGGGG